MRDNTTNTLYYFINDGTWISEDKNAGSFDRFRFFKKHEWLNVNRFGTRVGGEQRRRLEARARETLRGCLNPRRCVFRCRIDTLAGDVQIAIKTADVRGAGTSANVFIVVHGSNGDSGEVRYRTLEPPSFDTCSSAR